MYLKNLTVFGFKSFPDRTALDFQPGITAIVGPNGCGKSNIADAIRWVLGEQSAKALRGGEMADVIFNGTEKRKALGVAEVSLTVGGIDQDHLKASGVEVAYHEVTLTRRVFRDGGSEYYINKVPCRLKDIQQLFMGTGVGRVSYSIMAQGNITQILSSRPEERRAVFEEAAGITRFKAQKKEALRKLESTELNMLRVEDLVREVKRQIISLQRQSGKARRYKQYMRELQYLDCQLARHQYDVLLAEISERKTRHDQLRSQIDASSGGVMDSEEKTAQLRDALSDLEHQVNLSQQRALEMKGEMERLEGLIEFNLERRRELEEQRAAALNEIAQAEDRRVAAERDLAAVTDSLGSASSRIGEQRADLTAKAAALDGVESELRKSSGALRQTQNDAFALAQKLTRIRNEMHGLEQQKQGNLARLDRLSSEKVQLEEERARLEARLEEFVRQTEAQQLDVQSRRLTVQEALEKARQLQVQLGSLGQELDRLQETQAEKRSRLHVLEQLQSSHEGFGAGALAALGKAEGVLGALIDRIKVPNPYVTAVEAALGHRLQVLLTDQPDSAREILADLAANKKGRACIASLGLIGDKAAAPHDAQSGEQTFPESTVPALSVVEADDSVKPLVGDLLGGTLIAMDLAGAIEAWRATKGAFDFVTRGGQTLDCHGVFVGGSANGHGDIASSILGRKNEIHDLRAQSAALQAQVTELSRNKGAAQSELTACEAGLQQAQTDLRAQEVAVATRQGELGALRNALQILHQRIDTVVYEIQSVAAQQERADQRLAELGSEARNLDELDSETQRRLSGLNASLERLDGQRAAAGAALTEAKVALAAQEQICASLRYQQAPLEQRIREMVELARQRRNEIESISQRQLQTEKDTDHARRRVESLRIERAQESSRTAELESQRDSRSLAIQSAEEESRGRRRQLSELQEQRGLLEVELAQKQMTVQHLLDRIQQKYQVNLNDVPSECIKITFAAEGPAKVVTVTPEEMAAAGVATDWNAVGEQVAALQKRIDEMGPVNLASIEEYEEAEQRHQFLSTQLEDLAKAKQQLIEAINKINTQTRQMFVETFALIRQNFQAMFAEAFEGGKADLHLVDEGDVLESGIEIVARPPGKQLQSISLLSGGEQTMTAVALLFAIYQVKPSPFCVLDELDAPLDESNINRFIRILQRFLQRSQFLLITHNKRTIAMADVLYGVTMQEQGVSKIVSVRLRKAESHPAPGRQPPPVPALVAPAAGGNGGQQTEVEEPLELAVAE